MKPMSEGIAADAPIVVDTDALSFIVRPRGRPPAPEAVADIVLAAAGRKLFCSRMTIGEIQFGAYKAKWNPARTNEYLGRVEQQFGVVELEPEVVDIWAQVRAARVRETISPQDAFVAATAIFLGLPLLTNNGSNFGKLKDLGLQLLPTMAKTAKP